MNTDNVLVGINSGDSISQGMFFRLTFAAPRFWVFKLSAFSFPVDAQNAFNALDAASGLAMPVSDLAVAPGQVAAVFDVLVRPAAFGLTAAALATYFNTLVLGMSLTSMTLINAAAVQQGTAERSQLQTQLDQAEKKKDPLAVFGSYAKYLQWILLLLVILALLYYGEKAFKTVKAVV